MTLLNLQEVSRAFGDVQAVDQVSFSVDRGEVVGFLGPNGAGKSTTMRVITQYLDPDSGSVLIDGVPIEEAGLDAKRRIGYLPESNPLYGEMMVSEFLDHVAALRELDAAERRPAIDESVASTGIETVFYRPIGELSKGFKQRVGLAQAILHRPDLLILDEPTEGLDPNQRVEIRRLINELGKDRTVVLSTHVLSEVQHTCSRLLIINRGRLVADGAVDDLIARAEGKVRLSVEAQGPDVMETLRTLAGVESAEPVKSSGPGRTAVQLTADRADDLRPRIFETARDRGWTLYELHQEAGSLEELFRQTTADQADREEDR